MVEKTWTKVYVTPPSKVFKFWTCRVCFYTHEVFEENGHERFSKRPGRSYMGEWYAPTLKEAYRMAYRAARIARRGEHNDY